MHEVTFLGHKCTGKIILPDDKIIQSHMMRTALADLLHFVIFTDEYLEGKDNYVADALSRITITDLKNIQSNNKILKVTTRN